MSAASKRNPICFRVSSSLGSFGSPPVMGKDLWQQLLVVGHDVQGQPVYRTVRVFHRTT